MNQKSLTLAATALLSLTSLLHAGQTGAQHRLLVSNGRTVAVVAPNGSIERELKTSGLHDVSYLPNGNILFQSSWTKLVEADSSGKTVWEYDCATSNGNAGKPLEVHAFERLPNGHTMIAESGIGRIIEVDASGKLMLEIKLTLEKPSKHRDTRLVRSTPQGTYLVSHEGDEKSESTRATERSFGNTPSPCLTAPPRADTAPRHSGTRPFAHVA